MEKDEKKKGAMLDEAFLQNLMQNEQVEQILEEGEDRALLISATGERGIFVTGGRNPGFTRVSEAWS